VRRVLEPDTVLTSQLLSGQPAPASTVSVRPLPTPYHHTHSRPPPSSPSLTVLLLDEVLEVVVHLSTHAHCLREAGRTVGTQHDNSSRTGGAQAAIC
jgi:hypothetical protein